ncbi:MAG: CAP domain-containing protein [Acidobacteria bacterium]|nr:CAP domain-containing protein [Acidobacteriota bacterium]
MLIFRIGWLFTLLAAYAATARPQAAGVVPNEIRREVVEQINRDRAAAGLRAVIHAPELSQAADKHAAEMVREDYSSHWDREGWKPYMRYAAAGIRDNTAENIASYWCTGCAFNLQKLRAEAIEAHGRFMAEQPPLDGHRKSILDPAHTHVGIGMAYSENGFRMIEIFAGRYAELDALPLRAKLNQSLRISGRVNTKGFELLQISVFYDPLPQPMTLKQLKETYSYSLPNEEHIERPRLDGTPRRYMDGTLGTVNVGAGGTFQVPLVFWKQQSGVYTVAIWVRHGREPAFIGAMTSVFVEK